MPLSRAEIQRRYRERKKNDKEFQQKERERKRNAYVPVAALSSSELKKRRKFVNARVKKCMKNKRNILKQLKSTENSKPEQMTGKVPMTVAFPFQKKSSNTGVKKRYSHALKKAYRALENLKLENNKLFRDKKRIQKRIERLRCNKSPSISNISDEDIVTAPLTPKTRTKIQMKDMGLSPRQHRKVNKRLLFANVLEEDLRETRVKDKKFAMSMKIVKKYRCVKTMSKVLGVNRRTARKGCAREKKRQAREKVMKGRVQQFLEREDNSTILPGKKDTIGKNKKQKQVLNDYLHNLHAKFQLENPGVKLSRSQFSKLRPNHVLLANFCNRHTCLCSRHQNMALKLRALYHQNVRFSKNPDTFIPFKSNEEIQDNLNSLDEESVKFTEWKKVSENGKLRMKQVQVEIPKNQFIDIFMKEVEEFRSHVQRVKVQYAEMKSLRENLEPGHVMIWMDFAENFTCSALEEVQSAYWNTSMVTLHTAVAYFPEGHRKSHMSIVGISETLSHNASTVFGMIRKMIPIIKDQYPELNYVHYLTDSPTSQYRNKTIFQCLCDHRDDFGVAAAWDYLEAGHGKGPCDGLGASVKRSADMAIKQSKAVIQDAKEFFNWAEENETTTVTFFYLSQEEYDRTHLYLQQKTRGVKPVPGTMKIHAVIPISKTSVAVRSMSCHCQSCKDISTTTCDGWETHTIRAPEENADDNVIAAPETDIDIQPEEQNGPAYIVPEAGGYVAAVYDKDWYIGVVKETDELEVLISFMSRSGKVEGSYKWPNPPDEIWVDFNDIITEIPPPIPSGKSKRVYKMVDETIIPTIERCFNKKANR